jgi:hypothetical protein
VGGKGAKTFFDLGEVREKWTSTRTMLSAPATSHNMYMETGWGGGCPCEQVCGGLTGSSGKGAQRDSAEEWPVTGRVEVR